MAERFQSDEEALASFNNEVEAVVGEDFGENFGLGFCRPNRAMNRLVESAFQPGLDNTHRMRQTLLGSLEELDKIFIPDGVVNSKKWQGITTRDESLVHRWKALAAIVRGTFADQDSDRLLQWSIARGQVAEANRKQGIEEKEWEGKPKNWFDKATVDALGETWTTASWIVWDAIEQIRRQDAKASERTPILFAPVVSDGHVFHLVAEAVEGPVELVVPNWWNLGLLPFQIKDVRSFVRATQDAMSWVSGEMKMCRLRWHLVPPRKGFHWWIGLHGTSGMAAAAIAALATYEHHANPPERKGNTVLDPKKAITAVVASSPHCKVGERKLMAVDHDTLASKAAAAWSEESIDVVCVAQDAEKVPKPEPLHFRKVETVGEAFSQMRSLEELFDNWREYNQDQFTYYPAQPAPPQA